ncbi:MAG: O-antigen ligase family protein [bacterium]
MPGLEEKIPSRYREPDNIITDSLAGLMGTMFFDKTNALASFLLFSALAGWIYKCVREKRFIIETDRVGIVLLLMLASALVSSIFSINVRYSFREFRGEIAKIVLLYFLIITNLKSEKSVKIILKSLLAGAAVMAVIGVIGYFAGFTLFRGRTVSLYANQSYTPLGFYLLLCCCLLLGFIIHDQDRKRKFVYFLLIIVFFSCIMATLTRSVWLGFFSAVAISAYFYRKKLLLFFVPVILLFFLLLPANFSARFMTIFDYRNYARAGGVLSDRVQLWTSALHIIRDYPILGIGYGKRIFKKVYLKEGYILPEATERRALPDCHNLYLSMGVQGGMVGIALFLTLMAAFFREALTAYRQVQDPFTRGFLFGSILAMFEFLQIGLTGNQFHDEIGLYIIFLMAVTMVFRRQSITG